VLGVANYKVPLEGTPVELAGGKPVAPGEIVELSKDEEKNEENKALIESGALIPAEVPIETEETKQGKGGGK
jgi:hypothetical protein